jgi:hypothetical protein
MRMTGAGRPAKAAGGDASGVGAGGAGEVDGRGVAAATGGRGVFAGGFPPHAAAIETATRRARPSDERIVTLFSRSFALKAAQRSL